MFVIAFVLSALGPNTIVQVPIEFWASVSGTLVPLLTAFVTTHLATGPLKSVVNLVLSIVVAVAAAFTQHEGTLTIQQIILAAVTAYVASQATYHGFWKPNNVTAKINALAPRLFIGPRGGTVVPPPVATPDTPVPPGPPVAAERKPARRRPLKPR